MNPRPSPMISWLALGWLGLIAVLPCQGAIPSSLPASPASAGEKGDLLNLDLRVYVAAKPIYCLLVEKDRQRIRVLRHDGRLRVVAEYPAGTGENDGPKEKEGDAKTPEGVYFVTKAYQDRKLSVFGTRAFQLNYPNYCDLSEGRTGFGIYIHGTKQDLRLKASNGCVTLDNGDLERLAAFIGIGTPVFIVDSLRAASGGEGGYPDLAYHNFAGAKDLLLPDDAGGADFASLYLIRIHGQTVVAGEYWADANASTVRVATAYLRAEEGNRWSVVDRGPVAGEGQAPERLEIPGLVVDWGGRPLAALGGEAIFGPEEFVDRYLAWWREASEQAQPKAEEAPVPVASATSPEVALGEGTVVFSGLLLATSALSLGLALLLARRRWRREEGSPALVAERGQDLLGGSDGGRCARLQEDLDRAHEALQGLRGQIEEEARAVASLEVVQSRITALEGDLQEKQQAVERFQREQVALTSQGLAASHDQAQTLMGLQREMAEVRQALAEAHQALLLVTEREGMMQEALTEIRRLHEGNQASEDGEVGRELTVLCGSLRDQVLAMAKVMNEGDQARQQSGELALAVERMAGLLQQYALHDQGDSPAGESPAPGMAPAVVEALLQGLRSDLRQEQAAKEDLLIRLGRMTRLEEELTAGRVELASLRQEMEAQGQQAESDRQALRATIAGLQAEARVSHEAQAGLESRLSSMSELEAELARRQGEVASLHQEMEGQAQQAESDRQALRATIAGLQAEARLSHEAQAGLESRLSSMSELEAELARRQGEVISLGQELGAQAQQAESDRQALRATIAGLQTEVRVSQEAQAGLESRLSAMTELEAELARRQGELASLSQEMEGQAQQAESDQQALRATIEGLQAEARGLAVWQERAQIVEGQRQGLEDERNLLQDRLRDEQLARESLEGQVGKISELAEALAKREREVEGLQNEVQAQHVAEVEAKTHWEETLAVMRSELEEERRSSAALTSQLGRIGELEAELEARGDELSHLRQEIEQKVADAATDKSRWAGELAEIVLARQIEVTNLTGALHEAKEKSLLDHEEIRRLSAEMDIARESLRETEGQVQGQHDTVAALRQEIVDLQAQVEASEKKVAQTGAGAMSKGGALSRGNGLPYLPNDVLSKWIGRG